MTPSELEILRLKNQILALQILLRALCGAIGRTSPSFLPSLHETGKQMREEYSKIVLKGYPPEQSDLIAGEFQEAFDDLIKFIEAGVNDAKEKKA